MTYGRVAGCHFASWLKEKKLFVKPTLTHGQAPRPYPPHAFSFRVYT
jgi:hypothetical protein